MRCSPFAANSQWPSFKKFDIHANLITQWKTQLLQNAVSAFEGSSVKTEEVDVEKLHAKIGQLTLENDFLEKAMIERDYDLPLTRQADLLEISRDSLYYVPVGPSKADLELMREMDRIHTDFPFMGARQLRDQLRKRGYRVGRRNVARLMQLMGIEALYRKKQQTSKRNPAHPIFPYSCGVWRSSVRTKSRQRISPTSQCSEASRTSLPFLTGRRAAF